VQKTYFYKNLKIRTNGFAGLSEASASTFVKTMVDEDASSSHFRADQGLVIPKKCPGALQETP